MHEAAVAAAEEAEEVAADVAAEPETLEDGEPVEEKVESEDTAEREPEVVEKKVIQIPPRAAEPADETGGPIRRWLRRRNR